MSETTATYAPSSTMDCLLCGAPTTQAEARDPIRYAHRADTERYKVILGLLAENAEQRVAAERERDAAVLALGVAQNALISISNALQQEPDPLDVISWLARRAIDEAGKVDALPILEAAETMASALQAYVYVFQAQPGAMASEVAQILGRWRALVPERPREEPDDA